jgi:SAM-dependent methyltransferase
MPPLELVRRISQPFSAEDAEQIRLAYSATGHDGVRRLEAGLAAVGRDWTDFSRLLDFGSGPGRILRWLEPLAGSLEQHGLDVDPALVAWASEHVTHATFTAGPHEPPTPYPDGHFNLVINHSVFTHLDERRQDLWLAELRRLTAPGGIVLLTVHGAARFNAAIAEMARAGEDVAPYRRTLERDGILFVEDDTYIGSSHPDWYHTAFHAPWYVFEHWHRFFGVRAYLPEGSQGHDLVVLERRGDGEPVPEPIGHAGGAAAEAPAPRVAGGPLAQARRLHENWPAPRGALGHVKRRVLAAALEREDRRAGALLDAVADLAARTAAQERRLGVLPASLYEQAQRIGLLRSDTEAALRRVEERLAALERRDDAQP